MEDDAPEIQPRAAKKSYPEEKLWPQRPGNRITWNQALDYFSKFDPERHWSHTIIYVYRIWPVIIKTQDPRYIDKISDMSNLSYNYMLTMHGGGQYKFIAKDTDGQCREITFTLDIPITEAMPKLDYSELDLGRPENRSYIEKLKNEGIIDSEGKPMNLNKDSTDISSVVSSMQTIIEKLLEDNRRMREVTLPQPVDKDALSKSMDMLSQAYKTAIDTTLRTASETPMTQVTEVMQFVKTLVEQLTPKQQNSPISLESLANLYNTLMDSQLKTHQAQMELMRQLMEHTKKDRLEEMLDMVGRLSDVFGIKVGKSEPESKIETIMKYGLPIAQSIERIVNGVMAAKGGNIVQPNPAPQPVPQPASPAEYIIRNYGGLVLKALGDGVSGDEFAYQVIDMFGMPVYTSITSVGKDTLIEAAKSVPEFSVHITSIMQSFEKFVEDFFDAPNRIQQKAEEDDE